MDLEEMSTNDQSDTATGQGNCSGGSGNETTLDPDAVAEFDMEGNDESQTVPAAAIDKTEGSAKILAVDDGDKFDGSTTGGNSLINPENNDISDEMYEEGTTNGPTSATTTIENMQETTFVEMMDQIRPIVLNAKSFGGSARSTEDNVMETENFAAENPLDEENCVGSNLIAENTVDKLVSMATTDNNYVDNETSVGTTANSLAEDETGTTIEKKNEESGIETLVIEKTFVISEETAERPDTKNVDSLGDNSGKMEEDFVSGTKSVTGHVDSTSEANVIGIATRTKSSVFEADNEDEAGKKEDEGVDTESECPVDPYPVLQIGLSDHEEEEGAAAVDAFHVQVKEEIIMAEEAEMISDHQISGGLPECDSLMGMDVSSSSSDVTREPFGLNPLNFEQGEFAVEMIPLKQEIEESSGDPLELYANDWRRKYSMEEKLHYMMRTPGCLQDVKFIVGEERSLVFAHSMILFMNSEVLTANMSRGEDGLFEIDVSDVPQHIFNVILEFMYTDKLNLDGQSVEDVLLYGSQKFGIPRLSEKCVMLLQASLDVSNCIDRLIVAKEIQQQQFYDLVYHYVLRNAENVFKSGNVHKLDSEDLKRLLSNDELAVKELTLFSATIIWATNRILDSESGDSKVSGLKLREQLGEILFLIRFPLMSLEDFKLTVVPSEVLTPTEVIQLFSLLTPPYSSPPPNFPFSFTPRRSVVSSASPLNSLANSDAAAHPPVVKRKRGRPRKYPYPEEIKSESVKVKSEPVELEPATSTSLAKSMQTRRSKRLSGAAKSSVKEEDESTDEEWKKDSSDSSDSDDPSFKPLINKPATSSGIKRTYGCRFPIGHVNPVGRPPLNGGGIRGKLGQPFSIRVRPKSDNYPPLVRIPRNVLPSTVDSSSNLMTLSQYVSTMDLLPNKQRVNKVKIKVAMSELPKKRILLPSIEDYDLEFIFPLNSSFKMAIKPVCTSEISRLIFFDKIVNWGQRNERISCGALNKLWDTRVKLKINIHVEKITLFKMNPEEGSVVCCFSNYALLTLFSSSCSPSNTPPLRHLTISHIPDLSGLSIIPSTFLSTLVILNVSGISDSLQPFLRKCASLKEFYFEANRAVGQTIFLDNDLHLFKPSCKLNRVVLANCYVGLQDNSNGVGKASNVKFTFYFCRFTPFLMLQFGSMVPNTNAVHLKQVPLPWTFISTLLETPAITTVGVQNYSLELEDRKPILPTSKSLPQRETRAATRAKSTGSSAGTTSANPTLRADGEESPVDPNSLTTTELKELLRQTFGEGKSGVAAKSLHLSCNIKTDYNAGFLLRRSSEGSSESTTQTSFRWFVMKMNRNSEVPWGENFLRSIYNDFMYARVADYAWFKLLSSPHFTS